MNVVAQKVAVLNAVKSVFPNYELGGEVTLSSLLKSNSDKKKEIQTMVFEGFKAGTVLLSESAKAKYEGDDAGLRKYSNGMIDNWVRKNPDFNCGAKYTVQNPGSRAGSQDAQIRELRKLRKQTTDANDLAQIDEAISARLAEIKPKQTVQINVDALPTHLKHLAKSSSSTESIEESAE